jgi:hypothetical protein
MKFLFIRFTFILLSCFEIVANAQEAKKEFIKSDFDSLKIQSLKRESGNSKKLLNQYELQSLIALSFFPELKNINISYKLVKSSSTLVVKPSFTAIFQKPAKRKYTVYISKEINEILAPILLENLPFDAQIGILGHELSHVSDFNTMKGSQILKHALNYTLSKKYGDQFEYRTDQICIKHGLGNQLLYWSEYIRTQFNIKNWAGASNYLKKGPSLVERYMNPESIILEMSSK